MCVVCVCVRACTHAQVCLTLCSPMDYSLPCSSAHGIFQARILEWVSISFSRGSSQPKDQSITLLLLLLLLSHFSRVRLCVTPWMAAHQAPLSLGFSRQEHWSGLPFPSPMHESEKNSTELQKPNVEAYNDNKKNVTEEKKCSKS